MEQIDIIVNEFQCHASPIWTRKLMEVIKLKDSEVEQVKTQIRTQKDNYIQMEQQRNTLRKQVSTKDVQLTDLKVKFDDEFKKLNIQITELKKKK